MAAEQIDYNADFNYVDVLPSRMRVVYENNMVRIKGKDSKASMVFGKIIDVDGMEYHSNEI